MDEDSLTHAHTNFSHHSVDEVHISSGKRAFRRILGHRVELVTDASRGPEQDRHHREVVYAWLQGLRIPFLIASMATYMWWHNVVVSVILFVICIPLPWIAVVIANGVGEKRDPRKKAVYKPAVAREQAEYVALNQTNRRALDQKPSDCFDDTKPMVIDMDSD
ncbi:hypothetical protein FRC0420_01582 [Corynebacterium diphtheriae]|nr:hypothetical protein FRC0420_01582 [Corynebacterium diphtheriae]